MLKWTSKFGDYKNRKNKDGRLLPTSIRDTNNKETSRIVDMLRNMFLEAPSLCFTNVNLLHIVFPIIITINEVLTGLPPLVYP